MTLGLSERNSYSELLERGSPKTITNEEDAQAIQSQIDELIDRGDLTDAHSEYLSLLGDLMWTWEQKSCGLPAVSPIDAVKSLLEDGGYRQRDLVPAVFPTRSVASAVLSGKRKLTYDYVAKLAAFFHVSPAVFFEPEAEAATSIAASRRL